MEEGMQFPCLVFMNVWAYLPRPGTQGPGQSWGEMVMKRGHSSPTWLLWTCGCAIPSLAPQGLAGPAEVSHGRE